MSRCYRLLAAAPAKAGSDAAVAVAGDGLMVAPGLLDSVVSQNELCNSPRLLSESRSWPNDYDSDSVGFVSLVS